MLNKEWKKFKSGSDVRGVALEGVKDMPVTLTDEAVTAITDGFAFWLCQRINKKPEEIWVSVGHDSRVSGPRMKKDVIEALTRAGINCYDFGLMSTPGMFMSCVDEKLHCDAAIQLTASHHPFNRNGLKFFTKEGGLEESDITALLENAQDGKRLPDAPGAKGHPPKPPKVD